MRRMHFSRWLVVSLFFTALGCGDSGSSGVDGSATDGATDAGTDASDGAIDAHTDASAADASAPVYCGRPADCVAGTTCATDGTCHAGDCASQGCVYGYACELDGTCAGTAAGSQCDRDAECGGASACLAGRCTAVADLCLDLAQCPAGDHCVDGRCVVACTSNGDCRDGLACDLALGACTVPVTSCVVTQDCGSPSLVCAGGICRPRSFAGTCGSGDVWFENGCVPDPRAASTCTTDGTQDTCAMGSICLRGVCWISCDPPNQNACAAQTSANTCKPLTSVSGMYDVCATTGSLGGQCSPTAPCSSASCVDGFCR